MRLWVKLLVWIAGRDYKEKIANGAAAGTRFPDWW